jgi:hypothetical protein
VEDQSVRLGIGLMKSKPNLPGHHCRQLHPRISVRIASVREAPALLVPQVLSLSLLRARSLSLSLSLNFIHYTRMYIIHAMHYALMHYTSMHCTCMHYARMHHTRMHA